MPLRTLPLVVLCLGLACVGGTVGAAAANEPPSADDVEQFIANSLPGYWKVDQLSLSDPVDYGNPVEPEWRWRYEALIAPREPLYVDGGRHEGVVLLELSLSPESAQTLYGVAVATFQAGSWSGEAGHENRPFDHGGEPASFFPGRTVVVGSPEERELREATRERALEELEATHKARIEELEATHKTRIAVSKIEQQAELATAKDAHRTALDRLKADLEAERERREVEHQNEMARAVAGHAEQLASLEADLNAEAARRRVEITESEKLTELTAEATERLAALQAAKAEKLAAARDGLTALQAAEAEMLAASDRVHAARTAALKKLFDMLGVVTGPDDYLALLDAASESELGWMHVAVLRHGLGSDDLALNKAAWRHLLQADMNSNPGLRSLLADYVANLKDNPDLALRIVKELLPSLAAGDPETLRIVKELLPSIGQWASALINLDLDDPKLLADLISHSCNLVQASFGREAGESFSPVVPLKLSARTGNWVDALIVNGERYGGDGGGSKGVLELQEGEYINRMAIWTGRDYVQRLEFYTNFDQTITGGKKNGSPADLDDIRVVKIGGRSGRYLHRVDVAYCANYGS